MRTMITIILALVFSILIGCGKQENPVPKVDLHTAVLTDNLDVILQHIQAGSDLNVLESTRQSTPLITAAALGKPEAAQILIDAGAELNHKNEYGSTALHTAAFFCNAAIVETLLEKGADKTLKNNNLATALEIVELPFEDVKGIYDAMGSRLYPLGITLDYDHIKATRPKIAAMLK